MQIYSFSLTVANALRLSFPSLLLLALALASSVTPCLLLLLDMSSLYNNVLPVIADDYKCDDVVVEEVNSSVDIDDDDDEDEDEGVKVNKDEGSCGNDRCNVALGSLSDVNDMAGLVFLFSDYFPYNML